MDTALLHVAQTLGEETSRQLDWLCTQVKLTAPQALTVEANKMSELKAALPGKPVVNAIPDAN